MLRLREWGVGQCIDKLKIKVKKKLASKVENNPWEKKKKTRKTKFERKDIQKSLLFLFYSPSSILESQYKQIRNLFISSFPKMTKMGSTEIITQFEKKNRDGLVCFKESIEICCHSEWASIYGYCGMRSLYARKQPSATLFWNCYTSTSLPRPLPYHLRCSRRSWDPLGKL